MKSPTIHDKVKAPLLAKKEKSGGNPDATLRADHIFVGEDFSLRQVILQNGAQAVIRFIQPEDTALLQKMFKKVSKSSIYYRYFGYLPEINAEFIARLTCANPLREMIIVVETRFNGSREFIAMANVVMDSDGEKAELAFLVADAWQKQGIGTALMDFIGKIAVRKGISTLYAYLMAINQGIIALLKKTGFTLHREGFDAFYAERKL